MVTLTREDRIALERACEARLAELRRREGLGGYWERGDWERKLVADERAQVDQLRRHLAAGEHLEIP